MPIGKDELIVTAICLQADYVMLKRQIKGLRHILKDAEQRANDEQLTDARTRLCV